MSWDAATTAHEGISPPLSPQPAASACQPIRPMFSDHNAEAPVSLCPTELQRVF